MNPELFLHLRMTCHFDFAMDREYLTYLYPVPCIDLHQLSCVGNCLQLKNRG